MFLFRKKASGKRAIRKEFFFRIAKLTAYEGKNGLNSPSGSILERCSESKKELHFDPSRLLIDSIGE